MGNVHGLRSLFRFLFGQRRSSRRVVATLPGVVALLFVGHAYEDGGLSGAVPYVITLLLNVSYVFCPTLLAWILLFGAFVFYTAVVATHPASGSRGEWVFFILLGLIPTLLLWLARPGELRTDGSTKATDGLESQWKA